MSNEGLDIFEQVKYYADTIETMQKSQKEMLSSGDKTLVELYKSSIEETFRDLSRSVVEMDGKNVSMEKLVREELAKRKAKKVELSNCEKSSKVGAILQGIENAKKPRKVIESMDFDFSSGVFEA